MDFLQVRYDYKTEEFPEKHFSDRNQLGWLAHEVQAVAPELVYEDEEGYLHVAYSRATALLTTALKELQTEFEEYKRSESERFAEYAEKFLREGKRETSVATETKT